mgnify:CR=1 FL=1
MKYLLLILLSVLPFTRQQAQPEFILPLVELEEVIVEYTPAQEIFETALSYGLDSTMAKLLVSQAIHETGNFKSKLFREGNNAFGMMRGKLDTLAIASTRAERRNGYAVYNSIEHSTLAVIGLLTRKGCQFKFNTPRDYAIWLKSKGYYEDTVANYSKALNKRFNEL